MEPDRGVSSKVWIATAISSCVVVVHFHHTQRVKAPSADLVIPLLGQNGHVPQRQEQVEAAAELVGTVVEGLANALDICVELGEAVLYGLFPPRMP